MSGSLSWSVHIVAQSNGAAYKPTIPNAQIGDPVKAQVGDIVTWGNETDNLVRQPWPTVGNSPTGAPVPDASNPPGSALYFSGPINPGGSSRPQWVVPAALPDGTKLAPASVINYCSKENENERGQIIIF
jgi:hypothetical protein